MRALADPYGRFSNIQKMKLEAFRGIIPECEKAKKAAAECIGIRGISCFTHFFYTISAACLPAGCAQTIESAQPLCTCSSFFQFSAVGAPQGWARA